jgi:hypothetical protein
MRSILQLLVTIGIAASFFLCLLNAPDRMAELDRIRAEAARLEVERQAKMAEIADLERRANELRGQIPHECQWEIVSAGTWNIVTHEKCKFCGKIRPFVLKIDPQGGIYFNQGMGNGL